MDFIFSLTYSCNKTVPVYSNNPISTWFTVAANHCWYILDIIGLN